MPVLEDGAIAADGWAWVPDDAEPAPDTPSILSAARFRALSSSSGSSSSGSSPAGNAAARGVRLEAAEDPDAIADLLGRAALVELVMKGFRDGRAFTQARALREHHRFAGTIRVTGQVLPDQVEFLNRCGVDQVVVPDGTEPASFLAAVSRFTVHYQRLPGD